MFIMLVIHPAGIQNTATNDSGMHTLTFTYISKRNRSVPPTGMRLKMDINRAASAPRSLTSHDNTVLKFWNIQVSTYSF